MIMIIRRIYVKELWTNYIIIIVIDKWLSQLYVPYPIEIFGEGDSMGPLNPQMKQQMIDQQGTTKLYQPIYYPLVYNPLSLRIFYIIP